jgi:hypothetical protein
MGREEMNDAAEVGGATADITGDRGGAGGGEAVAAPFPFCPRTGIVRSNILKLVISVSRF